MKCIIKIGHSMELMFPDDTGIAQVLKCLSKAVRVRDMLYKKTVEVCDAEIQPQISMAYVPPGTKFVDEKESHIPDPHQKPSRKTPKALPAPILRLTDG